MGGVVQKKRDNWKFNGITICVDHIEGLGDFVELEIETEDIEQKDTLVDELYHMATSLGLNPETHITQSYLELLANSKKS